MCNYRKLAMRFRIALRRKAPGSFALMTELAAGASLPLLMTIYAARHGGHVGDVRHYVHLCDRSVASLALHARFEMGAMIPVHSR